ncbi:hypothetical protein [Mangrovimonas xylaniphaga]|uniref:hypothetical protein n=1 Tax=Mangrovimonas xylaniphaga TaxID=1645915 RepID=UPI0006B4949E|nr:hypothetical protein [Mangrovimonas xylaniphaga]OMP32380.1 hypothetical protein BKM32_04840 [Mangrovimonas sp. DI 80]
MKVQNKKILASVLFVLVSFMCAAQELPPPEPKGTIPPGLPIDGLVPLLLALAGFYGVRMKIKQKK